MGREQNQKSNYTDKRTQTIDLIKTIEWGDKKKQDKAEMKGNPRVPNNDKTKRKLRKGEHARKETVKILMR
jgi:hypothetical protein